MYRQNDQVKGIAVDIVRRVFDRMGQAVDIRLFPFTRSLKLMETGQADGLFAIVKTAEREKFMDYGTEPLLYQSAVLFVQKESDITFNGDLHALSKYRFGVLRGATYGMKWQNARRDGIINNIEEVAEYSQNFQKLLSGRVDILIGPHITMLDFANKENVRGKMRELIPFLESVPTYLAFSKKRVADHIKQEFQETLKAMKKEGLIEDVMRQYLGG